MLDYPNQVSTVLFVGACNWRCGYCQNLPLLKLKDIEFENEILPKLIRRKSIINHVVISGGECLYDRNFDMYLEKLIENGFTVGIHTNGYNYEKLESIIDKVDFVGMDIKTSYDKYDEITNSKVDCSNIEKSLKLIQSTNVRYDIRTTVYPKYVDFETLDYICFILNEVGITEYNLQKYNPIGEDEFNYSNKELEEFCDRLNEKWSSIKINIRGLI